MSLQRVVILGAGGLGRELFQSIKEINQVRATFEVLGFLDDACTGPMVAGLPVLGPLAKATEMDGIQFSMAIAKPTIKQVVASRLGLPRDRWASIVHPTARISDRVIHGCGLILGPNAALSVDVEVGDHLLLNAAAAIGHDGKVGHFCTFSPLAQVLGNCTLGDRVSLGTSAVVLPGSTLGDDVTVGPLTSAMRRIPSGTTLVGSPGRRI